MVLKLAVSIGLLILAVRMLDVETMFGMLRQGSVGAFALAIAFNLLAFAVMGLRWHGLAAPKLGHSLQSQLAVYYKAAFLNTFTPANLGGDAYRLMVLKGGAAPAGELLKLLLRERILGLYGYVLVFVAAYGLIVMFLDGGTASAGNPYLYGLAVAAAMFALPFLVRPLGGRMTMAVRGIIGKDRVPGLEGWTEALAGLLSPRGTLWLMSLTFLGILLWVLSIQVIAAGFGLVVPALHLAVVATLVELIRLAPVTVQGIGLREGAFAYLLSFFGHNSEQCYVVGLAAYLALSVSIVLCGPIGQAMTWHDAKKEAE
ncbi:MAG TPA: lysylphosphatidylglycerol synthase transmembrane domain-containing protein [Burkholderiaceae bacterium]|nr:lysylphosphatidylglycerol synthase transmembrane domain-containing protein [Burkholderiaceae bacterium]